MELAWHAFVAMSLSGISSAVSQVYFVFVFVYLYFRCRVMSAFKG
jgi:hypothetical protein